MGWFAHNTQQLCSTSGHAHLACTTGSWCWAVKENITDSYVTNNPCLFGTQNIKKKALILFPLVFLKLLYFYFQVVLGGGKNYVKSFPFSATKPHKQRSFWNHNGTQDYNS